MNMTLTIIIPQILFCFVDLFLLLKLLASKEKSKTIRIVTHFAGCVTLLQAIAIITYSNDYELITLNNMTQFILCCLEITMMGFASFFWFIHHVTGINKNQEIPQKRFFAFSLPVFLTIFACIASYRTHWVFYIDQYGNYQPGTQFYLQICLPYFYILLALILTLVQFITKKSDEVLRYFRTYIYFVLPTFLGAILQIFVFRGGYTQLCISISLLLIYHELYMNEILESRRLRSVAPIAQQLQTYVNIISNAGYGVWSITLREGQAPRMKANEKMKMLLGIEKKDLSEEETYIAWYSHIAPKSLPSVLSSVEEMKAGKFSENTYLWQHPQLGDIYVRCGGKAEYLPGETIVLSGYHSDVTGVVTKDKEHQAAIEKARKDAEAASMAKSQFLLNMSHDIRTPMNAITGYTELIGNNISDQEKVKEYLTKMKTASNFLLSIINNVLEMSKIESGKTIVEAHPYSITSLWDEVLGVYSEMVGQKGISMSVMTDINDDLLILDEIKLKEVLSNILSNAYKYTPAGCSIKASLKQLPCQQDGIARIEATIADNGVGISKEFLPHIFEEFSRERSYTENKIEGTGLGLSITKNLVNLMGGTITVNSVLGMGSTFTITLDCKIADKEVCTEESNNKLEDVDFSGKRILLAEDNELNAEIAIEILKSAGIAVDHAEDGTNCIDMLQHAEAGYYDAILMDVQMPNMDGYMATEAIRKMEDTKKANIPIIAMTANAFDEDKKAAYRVGMNDHLTKPIDCTSLINTLKKHLHQQQQS